MVVQLGRFLVITGALLVLLGLLIMAGGRINFLGLGRLPGDIVYRGKNVFFYFPLVTCLVLSVVLTLALWLISRLGGR